MMFHVYADPKPEGYFVNEPFGIYREVLDADWLLYILLPALLIGVVAILMVAWRIHEIPTHKANHKNMRQAELVTALTLLGLFMHEIWAIALFMAYMDWNAFEDFMVRILRRSRSPAAGDSQADSMATVSGEHKA
ncbi:MAG: hypothetical protein IPJ38_07115 [Dechloromonas sp.]|jgi:hypothetical protein|uniref:Uncharacterized protein n=1 Tax=Candidatus Dechloromonas phosphorivorans TaxID=2899244 RepID=A0A935JVV2_9RHOO|nr:hypothetical protein [Candidatus Dechloromonas phosphorivorans]